jgi:hypothetical protein
MAKLSPEQVFEDLRRAIPPGRRHVSDREIWDAVNKAFSGQADGFIPKPKPRPIIHNGPVVLKRLIQQGRGVTEAGILETSPVPVPDRPEDHAVLLLQTLYHPDILVFCGERHEAGIIGRTIRKASQWVEYFSRSEEPGPHIIPNSLTGLPAPKKDGQRTTLRGDANVAAYRFAVAEFDGLSREDQISFWAAVNLPIVALIDSGGKSIHAWLDVRKLADVHTAEEWDTHIRDHLYQQLLTPLGVDGTCSNPSRLSRLPGHFRAEKRRMQRLLYLAPEGRRIFS